MINDFYFYILSSKFNNHSKNKDHYVYKYSIFAFQKIKNKNNILLLSNFLKCITPDYYRYSLLNKSLDDIDDADEIKKISTLTITPEQNVDTHELQKYNSICIKYDFGKNILDLSNYDVKNIYIFLYTYYSSNIQIIVSKHSNIEYLQIYSFFGYYFTKHLNLENCLKLKKLKIKNFCENVILPKSNSLYSVSIKNSLTTYKNKNIRFFSSGPNQIKPNNNLYLYSGVRNCKVNYEHIVNYYCEKNNIFFLCFLNTAYRVNVNCSYSYIHRKIKNDSSNIINNLTQLYKINCDHLLVKYHDNINIPILLPFINKLKSITIAKQQRFTVIKSEENINKIPKKYFHCFDIKNTSDDFIKKIINTDKINHF